MRPTTETIKNLVRLVQELVISEKTVLLYLYYCVYGGTSPTRDEIKRYTGLGIRTIRVHDQVLELLGAVKKEKDGRRTKVVPCSVKPTPRELKSHLLSILNITSQKTYARIRTLDDDSDSTCIGGGGKLVHVGSASLEDPYDRRIESLKRAAKRAVRVALKRGELVRPDRCSICGVPCFPDAHHHLGYEEEHKLDVIWVCRKCHFGAESPKRKAKGQFSVMDIKLDSDWKTAEPVLKQYFKGFEIDLNILARKHRFQQLVELLADPSIDFGDYCTWYHREKYPEKGFTWGLFLYPGMIEEYRDASEREGKYLKTTTRLAESDSHKETVEQTKAFLKKLKESKS